MDRSTRRNPGSCTLYHPVLAINNSQPARIINAVGTDPGRIMFPRRVGCQYSIDFRCAKGRPTLGLKSKRAAGRAILDDYDALNVCYKMVTDHLDRLADAQSPEITFSQFIPIYEEDLIRRKRRKAKEMADRIRAVLEPHFGSMKLREIKFTDIERYRNLRQDAGVKDSSIANEIALARALFNVAIVKEKVSCRNPFEKVIRAICLCVYLSFRRIG